MAPQLQQWVKKLGQRPIPILERTLIGLNTLCKDENIPVLDLARLAEKDPGLTVQLLRVSNSKSHGRLGSEITTVQQAIMMLGTERFRKLANEIPTVEKTLQGSARKQMLATFSRAYHAAIQATDWALKRRDMTPDEVFAATLLHFMAEMVLSLYVPDKLHEIYTLRDEEHVASAEAQYVVLGFTLDQLSQLLAAEWNLPHLVTEALQAENANLPRSYGIMLAVQLIRVGQYNWFGEKALEIELAAADWLDTPTDTLVSEAHQLAAEVARETVFLDAVPAAVRLIHPILPYAEKPSDIQEDESEVGLCLTPQIHILKQIFDELGKSDVNGNSAHEVMRLTLQGMHDGIGLNRAVFSVLNQEKSALIAGAVAGADNDPLFNRFQIPLGKPHLFSRLLEQQQSIWLNEENHAKFLPLVPDEIQHLIATKDFFCMSIHANGKPFGLIYADRHTSSCQLDKTSYKYFKTLSTQAARAIQEASKL